MRLTNRSGLPDAVVKALKNDPYNKGDADYSVTELIGPPRIRALTEKHKDKIEEDAEDRLWSLYGQLAHNLLERANEGDIAEKRFFATYGSKRVSGQADSIGIKNGILTDYKFTTAYAFKSGRVTKKDWIQQLNVLSDLLRKNGIQVYGLQIIGLIRDFSKPLARRNPEYPQKPIVVSPIEMWPTIEAEKFIIDRIALHEEAKINLPECSEEEMWAKDTKYALMKKDQKKAVKLFEDRLACEDAAKSIPGHYMETRPGERTRCEMYCSVSKFCTQYQNTLKKEDENG